MTLIEIPYQVALRGGRAIDDYLRERDLTSSANVRYGSENVERDVMKKTLSLEEQLAAAPPLLSMDEFMSLAEMGRSRFYKLVGQGKLRGVKRGRFTYIPRDEAMRFLTELEPLVTPTLRRRMSEHA